MLLPVRRHVDLPGGSNEASQGEHEDDDGCRPASPPPLRSQKESQHNAYDPDLVLQGIAGTHAVGVVQEDPAGRRDQHVVQEAGGQKKQRHRGLTEHALPEINIERPGVKRQHQNSDDQSRRGAYPQELRRLPADDHGGKRPDEEGRKQCRMVPHHDPDGICRGSGPFFHGHRPAHQIERQRRRGAEGPLQRRL